MTSLPLSNRRLALLSGFALLAVLGAASVCNAETPWRRRSSPPPVPAYRVGLEALDGSVLPTFRHGGSSYVLGEPGERYNVRVYNPTSERVEAVVTIDGRDAVSGEVGDYVAQRGYLIEPWSSVLVEGFRRSLDEVAAFRFTGHASSYSARRGTPQNVGVIGVAVFPEKLRAPRPVWKMRPRETFEREESAPSSGAGAPVPRRAPAPAPAEASEAYRDAAPQKRKGAGASNIGTEYGESQSSRVVEVAFERRTPNRPITVLSVRYDDYRGLEARGIDLSSLDYAEARAGEPEPFPFSRSRFAAPPR
ncbi:MAG: hypothetical protein EOO73_17720 [Myxococcales bacterium]|nr:MAG: hypothetical protein EOO73_17720 [Myxococcales bacterium]